MRRQAFSTHTSLHVLTVRSQVFKAGNDRKGAWLEVKVWLKQRLQQSGDFHTQT